MAATAAIAAIAAIAATAAIAAGLTPVWLLLQKRFPVYRLQLPVPATAVPSPPAAVRSCPEPAGPAQDPPSCSPCAVLMICFLHDSRIADFSIFLNTDMLQKAVEML